MRFTLVDRIVELVPGTRITALKNLTMAEEYLDDHFPRFPVMPGVLMLEAMTQTSAWLIRATDDFSQSIVILKEARNVKYARFVKPGQTLTISAEMKKHGPSESQFEVQGSVEGETAVTGKLIIEHFNFGDRRPTHAGTDEEIKGKLRLQLGLLYQNALQSA